MTWWNGLSDWYKRLALGGAVVIACSVILACSMMGRGSGSSSDEGLATSEDGATNQTAPKADSPETAVADGTRQASPPRATAPPRQAPSSEPMTDAELAWARARVASTEEYGVRLDVRRSMIYRLCRSEQLDVARSEFDALWDDIEGQENRNMAERAAMGDGTNLMAQKLHAPAIDVFERILNRWPDTHFAAEALFYQGGCHLEAQQYADAERVWQRLIEEHDDSHYAAWGWRKLALAQLLQGDHDRCLATLDVMAGKYADAPSGKYAEARRGYVHMVAGRLPQARAAYEAFLVDCSGSKYCRLVRKQMDELNRYEVLARAD